MQRSLSGLGEGQGLYLFMGGILKWLFPTPFLIQISFPTAIHHHQTHSTVFLIIFPCYSLTIAWIKVGEGPFMLFFSTFTVIHSSVVNCFGWTHPSQEMEDVWMLLSLTDSTQLTLDITWSDAFQTEQTQERVFYLLCPSNPQNHRMKRVLPGVRTDGSCDQLIDFTVFTPLGSVEFVAAYMFTHLC